MKRIANLLSCIVIGGTLGLNGITLRTFSFWVILIAVIVAEYTSFKKED